MSARFLAENFFDTTQFGSHTLTAEEAASGNEAFRVGSGRRVGGTIRSYWTPTTANSDTWIKVTCDRTRAADMIVIDRGHNLAGETITLQKSDDDFTTATDVFSVTVPSNVTPNSRLSDAPGVKTEEGAWLYKFDLHAAKYWRLKVDAMGANLKPQIPGLYLGKSWSPSIDPVRPWDDESRRLAYEEIVSPSLWVGSNRKAQRRESTANVRLADDAEYDEARYHIHSLFWRGHFMWYVPEVDQAERAWLSFAPSGLNAAPKPTDWPYRTMQLVMYEHEPKDVS